MNYRSSLRVCTCWDYRSKNLKGSIKNISIKISNQPYMKWSNLILIISLVSAVGGIFASNILIKREFDMIDKSDKYWNFIKLTDKPFRHISITGGNVSNIVYEQSPYNAVKVMREWHGSSDGTVKADVINDTLKIVFLN